MSHRVQANIYEIVHLEHCEDSKTDSQVIYIGSTWTTLKRRWSRHVAESKKVPHTQDIYNFIQGHGGIEKFDIELIEVFPCTTDTERYERETHWIKELKPLCNKKIPYVTEEERVLNKKASDKRYRDDHKEEAKAYKKNWHENHKEEINSRRRHEYQNNPEFRELTIKANNEYTALHREEAKERARNYYHKNKEKIMARYKERIQCPQCSKELSCGYLKKHLKVCLRKAAAIVFQD